MSKKEEFVEWFDSQKFKGFSVDNFIKYFDREGNTFPPKSKWKNIVETMKALELLLNDIKMPIRITSSYRSAKYNKSVGGDAKSSHKDFNAVHIQVDGVNATWVLSRLERLRRQGKFNGSLGVSKTYVHLDTSGDNITFDAT